MTQGIMNIHEKLYKYMLDVSLRETPTLERARKETSARLDSNMIISADQGQLLNFLVRLIGAKKAIEIGTFTGYGALWIAYGLPDDGLLITCDIDEEITQKAKEYWKEAGMADKIDLRIGPALETLDQLITQGRGGEFDFAFIDADKKEYDQYYEKALVLLRSGGLIAVDNTLWYGRVVHDDNNNDQDTVKIKQFNEKLHKDHRIHLSLLAMADGLTLAMKK